MTPPPLLPYAPRRRQPLSLWNPLDYLVLLYWVFYFPQALRWYVETFSKPQVNTNNQQTINQSAIQYRLAFQGLLILIIIAIGLFPMDEKIILFSILVFGIIFGMAGNILFSIPDKTIAFCITFIVVYCVTGSVIFSLKIDVVTGIKSGLGFVFIGGIMVFMGSYLNSIVGLFDSMISNRVGSMAFSIIYGMVFGIFYGIMFNSKDNMMAGVVAGVAAGMIMFRPDAILLGFLSVLLQPSKEFAIFPQRVSPLPIWGLHRRLIKRLLENWKEGLNDCEGLLRYSLQSATVIAAIQQALKNTSNDLLLMRIASWCSMTLCDWYPVYYQSANLKTTLNRKLWNQLSFVPHRWRPKNAMMLSYNTPVRAACAGFWHLHKGELDEAVAALAVVHFLPHGEEIYANARALSAAANCQTLEQITGWQPPPSLQGKLLRPPIRAAFDWLNVVVKDIDLVLHARSTRQRNSALNRASGRLHGFPAELTNCPTPERPQLEKIAAQWLDIILASANAVGSLEVREPVASPYIVGAPVPAAKLAGRQDVLAQIEATWAKPEQRDSLVIFGHRRMGKTSIARAVLHLCRLGDNTRLAFLNLQIVEMEGLSDLCHAIAFALWEADPKEVDEPAPEDYEQHPLAALRRLLSRLGQSATPRRYILILDEYELLEEKLPDTMAGDRTALLRGLTQQHSWLALGLVGLHSLQERSASLREAIFGWRPIPVGLMDRDAFADLLQVEKDAFPLEYGLDAIDRAYQLTGGQPFLGQLLGDSLVQRFNQQLKQQLEPPAPTFTATDVDTVVEDSRFYLNGHVYFNGIWAQAGEAPPEQQALLKILANHDDGLDQKVWREQSGLDVDAFAAALDALERHDVVTDKNGICRYSVELMRRWVATHAATQ